MDTLLFFLRVIKAAPSVAMQGQAACTSRSKKILEQKPFGFYALFCLNMLILESSAMGRRFKR
jgi:hypothetical protein